MNKISKWKLFLSLIVIVISTYSCSDFFEKNLTKQKTVLLSPPDGYSSTGSTVSFYWEEVKGAEEYNLQVVDSTFNYIKKFELDTDIVSDTHFTINLLPGNYQWRVKAKNNGSSTSYATFSLSVLGTSDLSGQSVILVSPSDNLITSVTSQEFKWDSLFQATEYRFQLVNLANSNQLADVILQTLSYTASLPNGKYQWSVRGQNASSNSNFSTRTITVDTIPPVAPAPQTPVNGATGIASPATLTWTRDNTAIGDSLYISPDSLFTLSPGYIRYTTNTNDTFSMGSSGQAIFWKVKSFDAAGNKSPFSALSKFTFQ